ncbi:hypothetical protein [Actinoplanes sp. NPDC048796]|uniref:hypothetical protein n=1 Tax=unclassified Actinoplanes TaxID=2626549 RepID=UPI0033EADF2D
MTFRTWAKLLGASFGVAALGGASQLGLAYGLGVLRFTRVVEVTARDEWIAQLAWVAWFAMTAAAIGAVAARTLIPHQAPAGSRFVPAVVAGFGAAAILPLTMQPARAAQVTGVDPVFVVGACAALGAAVGIFAAYAVLRSAVARWSVLTLTVATWVIALVSVAPSLRPGQDPVSVRLGVLDLSILPDKVVDQAALFTMPALALICGLVIGLIARRGRHSLVAVALAGLPGPALLTVAYLIAGPGAGADRYQEVPYWAAMTAAGAGVFGSVLAAVLRRGPVGATGEAPPTADRPPLPQRDAQPHSAIAQAAAGPSAGAPTGSLPGAAPTGALPGAAPTGPLPGAGAAQAITGRANVAAARATVAARASAAAQRPDHELRPSDTGVLPTPSFDGFTPPQPRHQGKEGELSDWVSGLGR